jgi:hypothetical protein
MIDASSFSASANNPLEISGGSLAHPTIGNLRFGPMCNNQDCDLLTKISRFIGVRQLISGYKLICRGAQFVTWYWAD